MSNFEKDPDSKIASFFTEEDAEILPFAPDIRPSPIKLPVAQVLSPEATVMLNGMHQHALDANECFPLHGYSITRPKVVHVEKGRKTYEVAVDYLTEQGVNPEEAEIIFTERGGWRLQEKSRTSVYNSPPDEINRYLSELFLPINQLIDRSLDGLSPDGFNKHGRHHANRVVRQGLVLLDYVAEDVNCRKNLVIAGQAHDIGNIFGRDAHPHISAKMLQRIVPTVKDDPDNWKAINRAIILHDSDNLRAITSTWETLPSEERLSYLADYLRPEGLALLIADKVEVGRDRVSDKILAGNLIRDPHAVVNLLGRHDGVEIFGDSFVWNLKYNPEFTTSEIEKFKHFALGWKRRTEDGEVNISFSDWKNMFWGIYTERAITTIEASLAFFPYLEKVEIAMTNAIDTNERARIVIHRDRLDESIENLRNEQVRLKKAGVLKYR